ncbi:ferredoxin reductase domain-containing protein [Thiosocius teredinicola]|uniref:oxidoreductase n=1 Tax=Thiosocius teredinicola TaxID=1973002 RepID=UPI00099120D3
MTSLSEYDTSDRYMAKVLETHRITPENAPEVRSILLNVSRPGFHFDEGQSVGVLLPGPHEHGELQHFRLYTIASAQETAKVGEADIELCVRRCFYIDEVNGEEYPGRSSNFLCDARPGDTVILTGPYGDAFRLPNDNEANLLLIGTGTGIAPFRAFVRHIYENRADWKGDVRLYYGARTGMEKLYQNVERNDFANYYDHATFEAFEGLSKRPWMHGDDQGLSALLEQNAQDIWERMQKPKTYVYIAGLENTREAFNKAMVQAAGSEARLRLQREEMMEQGRWSELIYG